MRKFIAFIKKLLGIKSPSRMVDYKEQCTKCDTCEYLYECLSENHLIECTTCSDSGRHFIHMMGSPCKRMNIEDIIDCLERK